jgi:dTMP kinase
MIISLEGLDASGKNTQLHLLKARLAQSGRSVASLSFPRYGDTTFSRFVADYLNGRLGELDTVSAQVAALLFAGDRMESAGLIEELRAANDVLVLDRYVASNLAYQGARVPPEALDGFLRWLSALEHDVNGLPLVDLTVLLEVPPATSARMVLRKSARGYTEHAADLHERNEAYLARSHDVYQHLCQTQFRSRWTAVDCVHPGGEMRPADDIAADIWRAVEAALPERGPREPGTAPASH